MITSTVPLTLLAWELGPTSQLAAMTIHPLWSTFRDRLQSELEPHEWATWVRPLTLLGSRGSRLEVGAPNATFVSTLRGSYGDIVRSIELDLGVELELVVPREEDDTAETPRGLATGLNPRYVFDSFVVGSSNQFAHAAARAVAESPSHSYNPLFLYGGVGLGKTHLLHAIGHAIVQRHPHLTVAYLPAEQFVNDLINSIRFERMPVFRERYRTIDVLMIDDVQFIANKERTQEEFFHTFNTLYTAQKQIILSSDSSPRQIPTLEERLRSRFEWGLIADIQPPDLETKIAILRRKADLDALDLPDEVALFLAQLVRSNVRELEGLLTRVIAFSSLTGRPLSLDLAQETLKDIVPGGERRTSAAEIAKFVARHYGLKVSELKSRSNAKQVAFPRQVAMYLCKRLTNLSFPEIGRQFNGKHHSTVMYSVEKIEELRSSDREFDQTLERMIQRFLA